MNQDDFFIDAKGFFESNRKGIGKVVKRGGDIVNVDFTELSAHNPELAEMLIEKPEETIKLLEVALGELEWAPNNSLVFLTNLPEFRFISLGDLRAKHIGSLVSFDARVLSRSESSIVLRNAKFECPSCGTIVSVLQPDKRLKEPIRCSCGRRGGFKPVSKDFVDAFDAELLDEKSKRKLSLVFDEHFSERETMGFFEEGNLLRVNGVVKEDERSSGFGSVLGISPLGVELLSEPKSLGGDVEEFLRVLEDSGVGKGFLFEKLIGKLFEKKGYSVEVTKKSGDYGIDVVASKGAEKVAIQCKFFKGDLKIPNKEIQQALGSLVSPYDANKLIFVTTAGGYTPNALNQASAAKVPVELWDREKVVAELKAHFLDLEEGWEILSEWEAGKDKSSVYDEETKTIDIDRVSSSSVSGRNNFAIIKEAIKSLEVSLGKRILLEELRRAVGDKISPVEFDETLNKLVRAGELIRPVRGYLQRV